MENWEFIQELKKHFPTFYELVMDYVYVRNYDLSPNLDCAEILITHIFKFRESTNTNICIGGTPFKYNIYYIAEYDEFVSNRVSNQYVFNYLKKNENVMLLNKL